MVGDTPPPLPPPLHTNPASAEEAHKAHKVVGEEVREEGKNRARSDPDTVLPPPLLLLVVVEEEEEEQVARAALRAVFHWLRSTGERAEAGEERVTH